MGEAIQTLAFSDDGKLLAIGSMGRTGAPHLRLVDMPSREVIFQASPDMGDVHSLALVDQVDGRLPGRLRCRRRGAVGNRANTVPCRWSQS